MIVDLDNAALRGKVFHHLVGHVARSVANRATRRVRSDQRCFAGFQRVIKRLIRNVRNVHHHAQPIHLAHHVLAELREPVVHCFVRGRIRPFVIAAVRQSHVTHG